MRYVWYFLGFNPSGNGLHVGWRQFVDFVLFLGWAWLAYRVHLRGDYGGVIISTSMASFRFAWCCR